MSSEILLLAQFNLGAAAVGALLALALVSRGGTGNQGWRWLGLLLAAGIVPVVVMVLYETRWIERYPDLIGVHTPVAFLFGPLFYLCVRAFARPERPVAVRDAIHAGPFLVYIWWLWPLYAAPAEIKIQAALAAFYADTARYQQTQLVHMALLLTHLTAYLVAAWHVGRSTEHPIPRTPVLGFLAIWVILLVRFLLDTFGTWSTAETALIIPSSISVLLLVMGFQGMRSELKTPPLAYARSAMSRDQARQVGTALEAFIRDRQLHLDPELSLPSLAAASGYSRHQISEALNVGRGERFSDLVNRLRIEEAKRRIAARPDINLGRLADEIGFSSRSTFYAAFKKHTDCTPGGWAQDAAGKLSDPTGSDPPDRAPG